MKRSFCCLGMIFCASVLMAQANFIPLPPVIRMSVPEADKDSIKLSELAVEVQVVGNVATTTLDMIFTNSSNRVLEGEFEFPLAEGQAVCGYALDINGKLRQGVVVEKEKGRTVFEDIVRRNVDPGLVEMTAGNNFKTRVYPLPAKGSRHIQISYEETLSTSFDAEKNKVMRYVLNPLTEKELESFSFKINVYKTNSPLKTHSGDDFTLQDGYNGNFSKKNWTFDKPVQITIPTEVVNNSTAVFTQDIGRDTYFYTLAGLSGKTREKVLPKNLVLFYDVSSSMKNRNFKAEMDLIKAYAARLKNPVVKVIPFANELYASKDFSVGSQKGILELEEFLKAQKYDGATNYDFDFGGMFKGDEVLIFSDGISNWKNPEDLKKSGKELVINTINSCSSADHSKLLSMVQNSGGVYINLCAKSVEQAVEMLTTEQLRLIRADYDPEAVKQLYPKEGSAVSSDFSLAGILKKKKASVKLSFGYGKEITDSIIFELSAIDEKKSIQPQNIARLWAEKKIEYLNADYENNKAEILDTAKKFNIVTKDTSLIVLDSVHDYIRYGIEPPEDLRKEYDRLTAGNTPTSKTRDEEKTLEKIYRYFESFKKWWNTKPEEFKKQGKKGKGNLSGRGFNGDTVDVEMAAEGIYTYNEVINTYNDSAMVLESAEPMATMRLEERSVAASEDMVFAKKAENGGNGAKISIQAWNPDSKYLSVLKRTSLEKMYDKYMELKEENQESPSFYMEAAQYFWDEGLKSEAVRILSNLAEMNLENTDVLRALGNKLVEFGLNKMAADVFEKITIIRPELPQGFRDYALAAYSAGQAQKAVDALYYVATRSWDSRYDEVQMIALNDMNAIIAAEKAKGNKIDVSEFDKDLLEVFPVDVRVVLTWNTDDCDIDLWVTDPDGEKCYYGNKLTANGGRISRDFTQGYGPEEFCLKEAPKGKYKIQANYYGTHTQKILQPVIVQAEVYTNFGRPNQEKQVLTLQLESVKGTFTIGQVEF